MRSQQNKSEVTRLTPTEKELINEFRSYYQSTTTDKEIVYVNQQTQDGELWLVMPDVHRPFHNQIVWDKLISIIKDLGNKLTGIVLSGDYLDLFTLGSYNANSLGLLKDITLEDEYADGLKGIEELQAVLHPDTSRIFMYGNHEDRYFREINKQDNAKYGNSLKDPVEALKLKEYGYKVFTNWKDDVYTVGDIDLTHGVYANVHAAKKHLDMNGNSVMFGHTHRWGVFCNGDELGYNIGCLIDLDSPYFNYMPRMQRNLWTNGFSFITVDENNHSHPELIKIQDSSFYWRGKKY
jgi:predicted phosphodiesterase